MYLGRHQTPDDLGFESLQNAWRDKSCFVVIIGKKHGLFPWSPGYRPPPQGANGEAGEDDGSYAVLGWYRVKSYWSEYEPGRVGVYVGARCSYDGESCLNGWRNRASHGGFDDLTWGRTCLQP